MNKKYIVVDIHDGSSFKICESKKEILDTLECWASLDDYPVEESMSYYEVYELGSQMKVTFTRKITVKEVSNE